MPSHDRQLSLKRERDESTPEVCSTKAQIGDQKVGHWMEGDITARRNLRDRASIERGSAYTARGAAKPDYKSPPFGEGQGAISSWPAPVIVQDHSRPGERSIPLGANSPVTTSRISDPSARAQNT